MEHRGEILNEVLKELGIKKAALASKLNKTPTTISNWLNRSDLSDALMLEIGTVLHFDFSQKIPSLRKLLQAVNHAVEDQLNAQEPGAVYMRAHPIQIPQTIDDCQKAYRELEIRYMALQDQHIKVLTKLARVA